MAEIADWVVDETTETNGGLMDAMLVQFGSGLTAAELQPFIDDLIDSVERGLQALIIEKSL